MQSRKRSSGKGLPHVTVLRPGTREEGVGWGRETLVSLTNRGLSEGWWVGHPTRRGGAATDASRMQGDCKGCCWSEASIVPVFGSRREGRRRFRVFWLGRWSVSKGLVVGEG